jgi:hypothetical protein
MPARRALLILLILLTLGMTAREGETPLLPARPAAPMPGGEPPASPPTTFRVYLPLVARQGSEAPPRVDFGLVFITSAEWPADPDRFDRARRLGARWDRWPLYWSGVEISPGVYRWASVDTALRDALAQGFEVSLILLGTPGFYATGGLPLRPPVGGSILRRSEARTPWAPIAIAAASPPAGLYAPIFTDGTDRPGPGKTINPENRWAAFVYQAVARYRPGGAASREVPGWPAGRGVRDWEIWNEPDLSFFRSGIAADYARLLRVAAIAARQADPQARILFGGLAIFEKPNWLREVLTVLRNDPDPQLRDAFGWYFDILPVHSYSYAWQRKRAGGARRLRPVSQSQSGAVLSIGRRSATGRSRLPAGEHPSAGRKAPLALALHERSGRLGGVHRAGGMVRLPAAGRRTGVAGLDPDGDPGNHHGDRGGPSGRGLRRPDRGGHPGDAGGWGLHLLAAGRHQLQHAHLVQPGPPEARGGRRRRPAALPCGRAINNETGDGPLCCPSPV